MSTSFYYGRGDESPAIRLPWQEEVSATPGTYADLDLTGFTFAFTLANRGTTSTPDATLTGADGYVDIAWAADDLDLEPGVWVVNLVSTSSGRDRTYSPRNPITIVIK